LVSRTKKGGSRKWESVVKGGNKRWGRDYPHPEA